ncbi:MAG: hypothetical protein AAB683_01495 [Patescibacteria group bacterium]
MSILFKVVNASTANATVNSIVSKIVENIVSPAIQFLFLLALFYFIWGLFGFFRSDDTTKREEGKQHILWGTIGIAIMFSVYGIIRLIANTVGQSSVLGF